MVLNVCSVCLVNVVVNIIIGVCWFVRCFSRLKLFRLGIWMFRNSRFGCSVCIVCIVLVVLLYLLMIFMLLCLVSVWCMVSWVRILLFISSVCRCVVFMWFLL